MAETLVKRERRNVAVVDRRRTSRSGRRARDPHTNWRRLAWLFAAYAAFLSIRSLPESIKKLARDARHRFGAS